MELRDEALDNLQRHMGEVMRQFVGGEVDSDAIESAHRYLREAENAVRDMREELEQMEVAVGRVRDELERLAGGSLKSVKLGAA